VRQANNTLTEKPRDKENKGYEKIPTQYHNNLKIIAGLLSRAKGQPRGTTLRYPLTNTIYNTPQEVIDIVTSHYTKEQQRATPDQLPQAPWIQPQNLDNFEFAPPIYNTTPHPVASLDSYITRSYYDRATTRAPEGKAPGPDAITNELIKHLTEATHTFLYNLLRIMAKYKYTPKEWCRTSTCLLYKPNKNDPHIIAYYRPVALVNSILNIWTSILTNIGSS